MYKSNKLCTAVSMREYYPPWCKGNFLRSEINLRLLWLCLCIFKSTLYFPKIVFYLVIYIYLFGVAFGRISTSCSII